MKPYDSIGEMLKDLGSFNALEAYFKKRIDLMKIWMEPSEFIRKVIVDRDAYIDGFEIKEYDAFFEGYICGGGHEVK